MVIFLLWGDNSFFEAYKSIEENTLFHSDYAAAYPMT